MKTQNSLLPNYFVLFYCYLLFLAFLRLLYLHGGNAIQEWATRHLFLTLFSDITLVA